MLIKCAGGGPNALYLSYYWTPVGCHRGVGDRGAAAQRKTASAAPKKYAYDVLQYTSACDLPSGCENTESRGIVVRRTNTPYNVAYCRLLGFGRRRCASDSLCACRARLTPWRGYGSNNLLFHRLPSSRPSPPRPTTDHSHSLCRRHRHVCCQEGCSPVKTGYVFASIHCPGLPSSTSASCFASLVGLPCRIASASPC